MTGGAGRSIGIALLTLAVWVLGQVFYIVAFCQPHNAWKRVQTGDSQVVLDRGEGVARAGDAIFVCEVPHRSGPIEWHLDLMCYCAPATVGADLLSASLGGSCTVDKLVPTRNDEWGSCQRAHCNRHVDF
jgi:hypothetical protein